MKFIYLDKAMNMLYSKRNVSKSIKEMFKDKVQEKMDKPMKLQLPQAVTKIINKIEEAGFEAYAVGGCVRDTLLSRVPDDWDITTSATPEQVKRLFKRTIDTGIAHGTVTILLDHVGYEVTTYRIDGEYEDARHPKEVTYTKELSEDLRRRDFTINAMAYNPRTGIIDLFQGMEDLEAGIVRAVGEPRERFTEDALRMMRAVRFCAQLGYRLEEETAKAIQELAGNLDKISKERIQVELIKLVTSPHPEQMRELYRLGITAVIMPEFDAVMETEQNNPHHKYSVGEHIIYSMMAVRPDKALRLAMLFHDFGKPSCKTVDAEGIDHFHGHGIESEKLCKKILRGLKFDNDTIHMVSRLVLYHDHHVEPGKKQVRRAINRLGEDVFPLLLEVKQADMAAQSDYEKEEKEQHLRKIRQLYEQILQDKECVKLSDLAVKGADLIGWGMEPGRQIGQVLEALLEQVLEDPGLNTKESLYELYLKYRDGQQEKS